MKKIKKMGTGGLPAGSPEMGGGFKRPMPTRDPVKGMQPSTPTAGRGFGMPKGVLGGQSKPQDIKQQVNPGMTATPIKPREIPITYPAPPGGDMRAQTLPFRGGMGGQQGFSKSDMPTNQILPAGGRGRSSSLGEPGMPSIIGGRPMPAGGGQKPLVQQPKGRPMPTPVGRPIASLDRGGARPMPVGGGLNSAGGGLAEYANNQLKQQQLGGRPMKKGGAVKSKAAPTKAMASGGKVSSASKRADGCAIRGKTKA